MTIKLGQQAEDLAAGYLLKQGYKVLARNVRYPFGELDIVAQDRKTLVFVEVKYRKNERFSFIDESISPSKQKKLIKAAQCYLQSLDFEPFCRFDALLLTKDLAQLKVIHIKSAFTC